MNNLKKDRNCGFNQFPMYQGINPTMPMPVPMPMPFQNSIPMPGVVNTMPYPSGQVPMTGGQMPYPGGQMP
ncbi:MAG: hypothetical protein PHD10_03500, partial [Bacilli bacterium]|nr:hypothetical protein [Bacilli bacterium]MDD4608175.1 hypothetical protein [Bacilli bacterium]